MSAVLGVVAAVTEPAFDPDLFGGGGVPGMPRPELRLSRCSSSLPDLLANGLPSPVSRTEECVFKYQVDL